MFGNFIYFILVLLIYLTYPAAEETHFTGSVSLLFCLLLSLAFAGFTHLSFKRIENQMGRLGLSRSDTRFHSTQLRCSVLAVVVFALDVYGLSLPSFVSDFPLFSPVPTLPALLFLLLYALIWLVWWAVRQEPERPLGAPHRRLCPPPKDPVYAPVAEVEAEDMRRLRRDRPTIVDSLIADAVTIAGPDAVDLFGGES